MEKLEGKIIKQVVDNLQKSTKVSWDRGDVSDFKAFVNKMRKSIMDNSRILETLLLEEEEEK